MRSVVLSFVSCVSLLALAPSAAAQTPDGATPAEELICAQYNGVLFGLCNAICEAQDCPGNNGSGTSCTKLLGNWAKHSPFFEPACYSNLCERDCQKQAESKLAECAKKPEVLDQCEEDAMTLYDECVAKEACGNGCATKADYAADRYYAECAGKGGTPEACYESAVKVYGGEFEKNRCGETCRSFCGDEKSNPSFYECSALCALEAVWNGPAAAQPAE
ncbi:MAG: hypothetical protein IT385_14570 [Deltaproteobacteria bacterium]|nr:hypothetical protein [Deltaproteobacteria bacterium]